MLDTTETLRDLHAIAGHWEAVDRLFAQITTERASVKDKLSKAARRFPDDAEARIQTAMQHWETVDRLFRQIASERTKIREKLDAVIARLEDYSVAARK